MQMILSFLNKGLLQILNDLYLKYLRSFEGCLVTPKCAKLSVVITTVRPEESYFPGAVTNSGSLPRHDSNSLIHVSDRLIKNYHGTLGAQLLWIRLRFYGEIFLHNGLP